MGMGYPADRSERARQLVAEGKIGGPRAGSGRPRRIRPSELAAEAAVEHWSKIERALVNGIENGTPEQRSRAAERWVRLGLGEGALEQRERAADRLDDAIHHMTVDEVIAEGTEIFLRLLQSGRVNIDQLRAQIEPEPVDAVVVDAD